jgi:DNA polymerase V
LTKKGREIQDELRGINCLFLEKPKDKKNIGNSRSFGRDVYSKKQLQEALAHFATNASSKLRAQGSVCFGMMAFIQTNPFKDGPSYFGQGLFSFSQGTSDQMKIIQGAHSILETIYRAGYGYKKAGILLLQIVPRNECQLDLFSHDSSDNENLNQVMDQINKRYGPHTIRSASCGIKQEWKTIRAHLSQSYTTSWNELLEIEL